MKDLIAAVAVGVSLCGYLPYLRDIARGRTRPHMTSWLIWATLAVIIFAAQVSGGGGSGTWVMGLVTFMSVLIFTLSLFRGERSISRVEAMCMCGAVLAGAAWLLTGDPLISVLLATAIDFLGFVPTFRKSYRRPDEETASLFAMVGLSFGLSLAALDTLSMVTALNPAVMTIVNAAMVGWLAYRRRVVNASTYARANESAPEPIEVG